MNGAKILRERVAWTATVSVLATSLAWLGVMTLALMLTANAGRFSAVVVVLRAVLRAALALLAGFWPVVLAALLAAGLLLLVARAPRAGAPLAREVRRV
jgi:hypothetical protein